MNTLKITVVCLVLLFLAGCSTKPVQVYEGEALAADQQAMITAGENIEITRINGKKMKEYLLSNIDTHYALKPGKQKVVFNYTSVWAVSKVGPDGERSELVESGPQFVEFDASAGQALSFDFKDVANVREARDFALAFVASVVDQNGNIVAMSEPYDAEKHSPVSAAVVADAPANVAVTATPSAPIDQGLPTIDALKVLWDQASSEEKKEFLKWAFK